MPASEAGPFRRALELVGDDIVWAHGGGRLVPRPAVGILVGRQILGERAMRGLPPSERRALVDGRSKERISERDPPFVHEHESGELGRLQGSAIDPECGGGP